MSTVTHDLRTEHEALLEHVEHIRLAAREMPALVLEERALVRQRILEFLEETLLPHAQLEERELYPRVARILGHPDATAPMIADHVAVRERASELARADLGDAGTLQELLYGLHALIGTHFWKEETLYLPLLGEHAEQASEIDYGSPVIRHEP
jgi:hypothetical protein